jgi:predicted MFS family arabinose efflux permease
MRISDRDLVLLTAGNGLYAFAYGLYYQLLGVYALHLGASRFAVGVLNAVMLVFWAAGMIPGAWAAARFSLRAVIVGVWWITVPAAISFALAPTWEWMVPGFILSGFYMANAPAMKAYLCLKADPARVAGDVTLVLGAMPVGFIVSPLLGGYLADRLGMRAVFVIGACIFALSSTCASFIRDIPYSCPTRPPHPRRLAANRQFRRYLLFFLVGYLAVFVTQPFVSPYLAQVRHMDYTSLGIFAAILSAGAAALTPLAGRIADRWSPRAASGMVLALLLAGVTLFLLGTGPIVWGLGLLLCGAFDALRYLASGVIGRSFGSLPLLWGYGVFDALMGIPMAGGALIGGLLYDRSYGLPFLMTIAFCAMLIVGLVFGGKRAPTATSTGGRDGIP